MWWSWLSWSSDPLSSRTLADGVAAVLPSTVQIRVEMSGKRVVQDGQVFASNGTGFIIGPDGLILTNAHVVADMLEGGHIRLIYHDGESTWADLLAVDLQSDLALLCPHSSSTFDAEKYPSVAIADVDGLRAGDPVAAIGNPLGLHHSVSTGVISALHRSNEEARQPDSRIRYIQTDMHTSPGSSGGPLLTPGGQVIGMITNRAETEGIAFAIQLDSVRTMLSELEHQRKIFRPWLGFKGITLSPSLVLQVADPQRQQIMAALRHGVLVTKVHERSPASRATLRPGDIITHADGQVVGCLGDILMRMAPDHQQTLLQVARLETERGTGKSTLLQFETSIGADEFEIILGSLH